MLRWCRNTVIVVDGLFKINYTLLKSLNATKKRLKGCMSFNDTIFRNYECIQNDEDV